MSAYESGWLNDTIQDASARHLADGNVDDVVNLSTVDVAVLERAASICQQREALYRSVIARRRGKK